ncbi:MAG: DUF4625 domain-containing protein [Chitinophagales bacterium]|nr:DUF4625 domain-containing protein [Chitinophagales bacterium]MDW8417887.1 DUF4625 domain-containing protein [Chitinophagales bacterium]
MKNIIIIFTVAAALMTGALLSCQKKSEAPSVTITSPANNATIYLGDSLHIEGKLSDDESLHEAAIRVMAPSGDTVMAEYPSVHDLKTYTFHYHYKPLVTGVFLLQVVAEDHDGNRTVQGRNFSVAP